MPGFSHGPVGGMLELSHWLGIWIHGGPLQPTIMPGFSHGPVGGGCLSLVIDWEYGYTADHYNPRIDTRPHVKHFEFY
jgi:hypothetical protein